MTITTITTITRTIRRLGLFCGAVLLLAPLAAFAEGQSDYYEMMATADGMYVAASYGLALPGTTTFHVPHANDTQTDADAGTDWGLLGGRLAAGYSISGFRPELSFGYRTAPITSVTLTKLAGVTEEAALKPLNDALEDFDWKDSSISSLEVVASVYYDIDTGTLVIPYIGAGAGASQISLTLKENTTLAQFEESESVWALAFQGAAGVGFYVFDGLTTSIGYRLTGTTEATFESDNKVALALGHHIELGIRYRF